MGIALVLLLLFAVALIGAPIALDVTGHSLGAMSSAIMIASGIALALFSATVLTITRLYVKTKASEAFVRTGMGGLRVIQDGGALVLPVVHMIVRVSLETIRLEVLRQGADALITSDKLRADIKAEFFVRVQPDAESIQSAARSLGDKMTYENSVRALIEDKLVSALRTSAARKTLEQLNSERDEFLNEVVKMVSGDLKHNGFSLETVTLSKLDQTDVKSLKDDNIFDAQGMRTIAEITQTNLTKRNAIVREGEQARTSQDVATRKQVLELDRQRAEAEASQAAQVATVQAEQDKIAKQNQIQAGQAIAIAEVARQQAIEVAKRQQGQAIEVAEREKQRGITIADQAVEVTKRDQQKAVADAEAKKAGAEAALADAEAKREKARQEVVTVQAVATAERAKQQAIIGAQATAEQQLVTMQKAADGAAYKVQKDAEARKAAADAEAEAIRKKATADADAQKAQAQGQQAAAEALAAGQKAQLLAEAEGKKALAMVPMDVKAREVDIDKRRVNEVLVPELQARQEHGQAAQDFELAKFRIEQEAHVRVETAKATAQFYGKIQANVYGTPEDVARMSEVFNRGMGLAQGIGGFFAGANPETLRAADAGVHAIDALATAVKARIEKPPADGSKAS